MLKKLLGGVVMNRSIIEALRRGMFFHLDSIVADYEEGKNIELDELAECICGVEWLVEEYSKFYRIGTERIQWKIDGAKSILREEGYYESN